jgi:hypothetical protein
MSDNAYTALITGAHKEKPKFKEWVYVLTEALNVARKRLIKLQDDFAIETAVGVQLDAVGARVGADRKLPSTLTDIYFALDDVGGIGLDLGVWKGRFDPTDGMVSLDDGTYRAVIKSTILMNHWNGKNETLPAYVSGIFANFGVVGKFMDLQDFQTMQVAMNITPGTTPSVVYDLLSRRIIDVVSAGVYLNLTDNNPWFGLDYLTASVKGLDDGYWFPLLGIDGLKKE